MSVEQSAKAWKLNVQGSLKLVLLSLADHADTQGRHVFPSQEFTSGRCGISVRQVRRLLNQLEEMGLIIPVAHHKGGRRMATEYALKLDQPETNPEPKPSGVSADPYFIPEEFINSTWMRNLQPKDYQTMAHDVLRTKPLTRTNIRPILPEENPDKLTAFSEPNIESKTRPNESENPDICDIKGDIQDIKGDIAMSDQPSRTIIEPSIEPEIGTTTIKEGPTLEYFDILETLPFWGGWSFDHCEKWRLSKGIPEWFAETKAMGLRTWLDQRHHEYELYGAELADYKAAKAANVKPTPKQPAAVKQLVGDPWFRFQGFTLKDWMDQKQTPKQTTAPRQEPTGDIKDVWAATAARFEGKNTDDDKTET